MMERMGLDSMASTEGARMRIVGAEPPREEERRVGSMLCRREDSLTGDGLGDLTSLGMVTILFNEVGGDRGDAGSMAGLTSLKEGETLLSDVSRLSLCISMD
jgi:hypothetical protein